MKSYNILLYLYILLVVGITNGFKHIHTTSSSIMKTSHSPFFSSNSHSSSQQQLLRLNRIQASSSSLNPSSFQAQNNNGFGQKVVEMRPKPVLTSAITSCIGFGIADVLSQFFFKGKQPFSLIRLIRTCSYGFCIHGPLGNIFYKGLNNDIPTTSPSSLAKKVFAEQVIWGTTFVSSFLLYSGIMRGISPHAAFSLLLNSFFPMAAAFWTIWPIVHLVNYFVIKGNLSSRLVVMNTVHLALNIYFCTLVNR